MNNKPYTFKLSSIGSSDLGYITVAEYEKSIPFKIKRVYWTYFTPNKVTRGHHAHINLKQCLFAVNGIIEIEIINQQEQRFNFKLDNPDIGLYIPSRHWRTIKFSHSAVLLCLASEIYIKEDYIRDYNKFLNFGNL